MATVATSRKYKDGSVYDGELNPERQKDGCGSLRYSDGALYQGQFLRGLCHGDGVFKFTDSQKKTYSYEGEFQDGKFHGYGVYARGDGIKFQGQFKDGQVMGLGRMTFQDGSHGTPRYEGSFDGGRIVKSQLCAGDINKAIEAATVAANRARKLAV